MAKKKERTDGERLGELRQGAAGATSQFCHIARVDLHWLIELAAAGLSVPPKPPVSAPKPEPDPQLTPKPPVSAPKPEPDPQLTPKPPVNEKVKDKPAKS